MTLGNRSVHRLRVARAVILIACAAAAYLLPGGSVALGVGFVLSCLGLNAIALYAARAARVGYESLVPLLDLAAALTLVALTGGAASPCAATLALPLTLAAWTLPSGATGLLTLIAISGLAGVAPPETAEAAARFLLHAAVLAGVAGFTAWFRAREAAARPNLAAFAELPMAAHEEASALEDLCRSVAELLGVRTVALLRPDESGRLRIAAAPLDLEHAAMDALVELAGAPIVDAAVRTRRVTLASNARQDGRIGAELADRLRARSALAGPVQIRGSLVGVLVALGGRDDPPFGDEQLGLMQLAIATVSHRFLDREDPLRALVARWPDALALFGPDGAVLQLSPLAAQLGGEDPDLLLPLRAAAEAAFSGGSRGEAEAPEGWRAEALMVDLGARVVALARLAPAGGIEALGPHWLLTRLPGALEAPARALCDYARALAREAGGEPETVRSLAERLTAHEGDLRHAVEELLALALARLTAEDLRLASHDFGVLVRRALECSGTAASVPEAPVAGPTVLADEAALGRGLEALFGALEALGGGPASLEYVRSDGRAILWVRVPRAVPARVRAATLRPSAPERETRGLGVGLWVARRVALLHGGDLWFADEGRAIAVSVPLAEGREGSPG